MIHWLVACRDPEPGPRVEPPPPEPVAAPVAHAPPDRRVLVQESVTLDAGDSEGEAFTWVVDDGRELEGANVSLAFDDPGHHGVVLVATGADGRTATDDLTVTATWPRAAAPHAEARALAADADHLYVPMPDFGLLAVVERRTGAVDHHPTCRRPRTVALGAGAVDRAGVWVACEGDEVAFHRPDGALRVTWPLPRGSRPWGAIPRGDGVLVTLTGLGAVAEVTPDGVEGVVPVGPDARGLAQLGDDVYVSRWRSAEGGGTVWRLDAGLAVAAELGLAVDPGPDSDTNTRGLPTLLSPLAVRPDGRVLAVGGLKSNTQRGQFLEGVPFTHDTTTRADLRQLALDPDEGPPGGELVPPAFDDRDQVVGVAWSPDGDWLYALHLGMEVVDVFDAYTLRRAGAATPTGAGPDALLVDGAELFVSAPLSRELQVFDLARPELPALSRTIALLPPSGEVREPQELAGEVMFGRTSDGRMAGAGYAACGTCHPEGLADGRTWDFTQRGEGLRNTTSLRGAGGVAPLHWTANFDELQDFENDIRGAMGGSGFLSEEDFAGHSDPLGPPKAGLSPELDALAAYVSSLVEPLPSPHRDPDGGLSDSALRGALLFRDPAVGCAACHPAPTFTDSGFLVPAEPLLHDVGTLGPGSGQRRGGPLLGLDTPSLVGVWHTAPYLHDGSAPDLHAVLVDRNPDDEHGVTSHLSAAEVDDLVAWLLTLD